jgi:uncharacterized protein
MDDQPNTGEREHAADRAKARLREDLALAMRARGKVRVRVIRDLIAALDNAEAAPVGDRHDRYVVHTFGDKAAEVPRLTLSDTDVALILAREMVARREAVAQMTSLCRSAEAEELSLEAAIIEEYVSSF